MKGFLVDTNVVSELTKNPPDSQVVSFFVENDELWLSAIVVHELKFGIELLPLSNQRTRLYSMVTGLVAQFGDRILPVGGLEAYHATIYRAQRQRVGQTLDLGDALIAGTAKTNNLVIATRNIRDFDHLQLKLFNPWNSL